jgi:hypothetical protein
MLFIEAIKETFFICDLRILKRVHIAVKKHVCWARNSLEQSLIFQSLWKFKRLCCHAVLWRCENKSVIQFKESAIYWYLTGFNHCS